MSNDDCTMRGPWRPERHRLAATQRASVAPPIMYALCERGELAQLGSATRFESRYRLSPITLALATRPSALGTIEIANINNAFSMLSAAEPSAVNLDEDISKHVFRQHLTLIRTVSDVLTAPLAPRAPCSPSFPSRASLAPSSPLPRSSSAFVILSLSPLFLSPSPLPSHPRIFIAEQSPLWSLFANLSDWLPRPRHSW